MYPWILQDDYRLAYAPDANQGIEEIMAVVRYFLQFLGVIALVAFIYGGALMVFSFGDDERVTKGKNILIGATIGIVIILTSFAIVSTFITGQATGG